MPRSRTDRTGVAPSDSSRTPRKTIAAESGSENRAKAMAKPVVGVIANAHRIEGRFSVQLVGEHNLRALAEVADALPVMFAGASDITDIGALLEVVDGVLLTGARANVHPARFGTEPDPAHEPYDENRDALALALIEVCVARGVPIFGICRGLQEMNVAFGGSLHPEIRELPGRMNHRMARLETGEIHPDPAVIFGDRHDVRLVPGGTFARIFGRETIRVNSLHGQGILEAGERVLIEGVAEDGTIEAIRIADAPGFALGVQWHAEHDPQCNPINRALFRAFGDALLTRKCAA
jgi:putative glutamine amidotransferase